MEKIKNFKKNHDTLIKVSGSVLIATIGFRLGLKVQEISIINSLKKLAKTEKMKYMYIDGEKYILSMINEKELKNKY